MGRKDKAIPSEGVTALPIGARMRQARQEKGVTLSEMAVRLGYTKGYLSGIENGSSGRLPSEELVESYERELGLSTGELTSEGAKVTEDAKETSRLTNVLSKLSTSLASMITDPSYFSKLAGTNEHLFVQPFDHMVAETTSLIDLNQAKVTEFFEMPRVQAQDDFYDSGSYENQLNQFGFIRESHPTYGALLCFGQNPTKWLPGAFTRCTLWIGNDRNHGWLDTHDYRRDLITQLELSRNFLRKNLGVTQVLTQHGSIEESELPLVALEEALANALTHREYANETSAVYVDIFENRVEISSPGLLPGPMTLELLEKEHTSHPRNPQIARVFYLCGYVEQVGSGIERMQRMLANAGFQPAMFKYQGDETLTVTFYRLKQSAT